MGFVRRWLLFDFHRIVPTEEKLTNFHEVLVAEAREAIAARAVQGLARLLRQGAYTQPESHLQRLHQIQRAHHSVAARLESNAKLRPTGEDRKREAGGQRVAG